jgi:enediyne biosynthesis thioesterase
MRVYEYRHRVLFEDTNLVGNVYFTRYLGWQGRCREGFLWEHAPDVLGELERGLGLVTTRCSCEYLGEAFVGDEVAVRMRLARLTRNLISLEFEYWRVSAGEEVLLARGEQQVACVRRESGRVAPVPVPESLARALELYQEEAV